VVNDEVKQFTAEEILAMLLMKMKDIAETYLGQEVTNAVVAVPTQFNMIQRQAISYACAAAGLHVERIVNQSTIAVFSHYLYRTFEITHTVLVFDIGGGTVNVSLLTVETGIFEVVATAANNHLGGKDFDNQMVNYCVELLRVQYHKEIGNNQRALRRITSACERAKRTLSSSSEAHIILDSLIEEITFETVITRARFEEMNMHLFIKCLEPVQKVLSDIKLSQSEVQEVVLVGGSARIPKIQKMLSEFFDGKELTKTVNPDEAVAYGAAVQAAILSPQLLEPELLHDILILDAIPFALGVETAGGVMTFLIGKYYGIPAKKSQTFSTYADNQCAIMIRVFEGDNNMTAGNSLLGSFMLSDIPPMPRGIPRIDVVFDIDGNSVLKVTATERSTGKELSFKFASCKDYYTITRESNRSPNNEYQIVHVVE
jgi:L1 cell adhesion molecule like protein